MFSPILFERGCSYCFCLHNELITEERVSLPSMTLDFLRSLLFSPFSLSYEWLRRTSVKGWEKINDYGKFAVSFW